MKKRSAKETAERAGAEGAPEEHSKRLAELVDERTRELRVAREEMARSHRLLLALAQAAQAVQRARTPDEVYHAVGDEVVRLGYRAVVFTLTEEPRYLVISYMAFDMRLLRAAEKLAGFSGIGHRFPVVRGGIYDQVITAGRAVFLERAAEPMIAEALPKPVRPLTGRLAAILGLEQSILVPWTVDGEVHGLLSVTGAGLTEADVPGMVVFANQFAIALENARMHARAQREIAERKRAEERLRESEEQYRFLIESQEEGLGIVDVEERFTYANPAAHDIFGVPQGNLVGRVLSEWTDAEGWATVRAQTDIRQAGQTSVYELDILRPDGQQRILLVTTTPHFDHEGQFTGSVGVFRDVTDRVRAQNALRESEEKYRSYIDNAPDGVFLADERGNCLEVNKAACSMTGYSAEELLALGISSLTAPEALEGARAHFAQQLAQTGKFSGESQFITKDGSRRNWSIDGVKLSDTRFLGFTKDITARVQAEEALKAYSDRLEELVEERTRALGEAHEQLLRREKLAALGQLAGSVAHDMRTPLGAIKNTAYLLHLVLEEPEEVVKEALDILEREVQAAEQIVNSLLDFARTGAPARRAVSANLVVQEALSRISVSDTPRVEVVCQLDETLPTLLADPDQLGRVYINLILNAIQAMPDGGRLTVSSRGDPGDRPEWVIVSVSDTGVGIPEESLPELFEPLYTTKAKGIGLGLVLVKDLVERHGGTVEVESDSVPGKGSTFSVRLPTDRGLALKVPEGKDK